jgi:5-hydroxyisourate hydrolase
MAGSMSAVTTHILDAVLGKPAAGVAIRIEKLLQERWVAAGTGETDSDGRCRSLASDASAGVYKLIFAVGPYFERHGRSSIYPEITITVVVDGQHPYHLPLLLSDNSYTTYRGS